MPEEKKWTGTIFDYAGEANSVVGDGTLPAFKPGRPAEHEHGIGYYAPWEVLGDGFSEHSRRSVRALAMTGKPVHLRSYGSRMFIARSKEEQVIDDLLKPLTSASIKTYDIQIYQFVPSDEKLQTHIVHAFLSPEEMAALNKLKIVYNVWERQSISKHAVRCLNEMAQVWVACNDNLKMLERCGVSKDKLRVVPIPYFDEDPLVKLNGRKRAGGPVRFYHIGKWEPRKEQRNILGAFLMSFKPGQCKLYLRSSDLKTKIDGYPQSPERCIHEWMENAEVKANGWTIPKANEDIFLIKRLLTSEQIIQLHRSCDVYVTMSRGEGFDMPAFDAKLAGNRMVYVPSGGPQDFASTEDFVIETSGEVTCHPFYGWGTATYYDYELEEACRAMVKAYEKVSSERQVSTGLHHLQSFRAAAVGAQMAQYVDEVMATIKG